MTSQNLHFTSIFYKYPIALTKKSYLPFRIRDASPSKVKIPTSVRTSSPVGRASSPVRRPRSTSPTRSYSPTRSPTRSYSPSRSRSSLSPTRWSSRRSQSPSKVAQSILDAGRGMFFPSFYLGSFSKTIFRILILNCLYTIWEPLKHFKNTKELSFT